MIFETKFFFNYLIGDQKYELSDIKIFDSKKQKVLYKSNKGWLNDIIGRRVLALDIPECKRKLKLNLNLNYPFIIKEKNNNSIKGFGYSLYLPENFIKFKFLEERKSSIETKNRYENIYQIELNCKFDRKEDFSFKKFKIHNFSRDELSEFGKKCEFWKEKLDEDEISLDYFSLIKLLKKYKLIERI